MDSPLEHAPPSVLWPNQELGLPGYGWSPPRLCQGGARDGLMERMEQGLDIQECLAHVISLHKGPSVKEIQDLVVRHLALYVYYIHTYINTYTYAYTHIQYIYTYVCTHTYIYIYKHLFSLFER